jgi:hypothetical protein
MTDFFYRDVANARVFIHSNISDGWYDFIRFLTNEHPQNPTLTGPGWSVIEAYDGTNLTIPAGPATLAQLAGNDWNPSVGGTPGLNSWIVLETLNSNNTNHCQVWIKFATSTQVQLRAIPFQDFATGGAAVATPVFPSTSFAWNLTHTRHVQWDMGNNAARYFGYATEGNFIIGGTDLSVDAIMYFGELDEPADASVGASPADDRCYVIYNPPHLANVDIGSNETRWTRLSPLDNSTTLWECATMVPGIFGSQLVNLSVDRSSVFGLDANYRAGVAYRNAGHVHFAGWLRGLRAGHNSLGRMGTIASKQWLHFSDLIGGSGGTWVMKWDSATRFP